MSQQQPEDRKQALPTVHSGGTAALVLLEQAVDSANAVQHAIEVLMINAPNARDYHPQGHEAIKAAMREHAERVQKLEGVLADMKRLGQHVADAAEQRLRVAS